MDADISYGDLAAHTRMTLQQQTTREQDKARLSRR